ncbi:MAG: RNA polymerase sigma factor [Propioniciclava sp.]|uniref:RNA polymerase sigma factor n=1 Tax=Propioniciclava sp. TaxID=2038686 RepID=UPI0039E27612
MHPPPSPEERFNALFAAHRLALMSYAVRRVADPQDAADVVADTFLVAWRRIDEVPPGEGVRPWLFGVARRVLANVHRGESRRTGLARRLGNEWGRVWIPAPEPEPPTVVRALRLLSDSDAEIVRLLAWEELAPSEIAVVLDLAPGTVRVRLHRARRRLAAAMERIEAEETREPDGKSAAPTKRWAASGHVMSEPSPAGSGNEETA